jgi:hypothetical protein
MKRAAVAYTEFQSNLRAVRRIWRRKVKKALVYGSVGEKMSMKRRTMVMATFAVATVGVKLDMIGVERPEKSTSRFICHAAADVGRISNQLPGSA